MKAKSRTTTVLTLEDDEVCPLHDLCALFLRSGLVQPLHDISSNKITELREIARITVDALRNIEEEE